MQTYDQKSRGLDVNIGNIMKLPFFKVPLRMYQPLHRNFEQIERGIVLTLLTGWSWSWLASGGPQ